MGIADGDEGIAPADHAADDGVGREIQVLEAVLGDPGAGSDGIFEHFGIRAAHIADEADLVGQGKTEDARGGDEFLIDDRVNAHFLGQPHIFQVLDLGDDAGHAESLGNDAGQDVRFVIAGDGNDGVEFPDTFLHEEIRIPDVSADHRYLIRQFF